MKTSLFFSITILLFFNCSTDVEFQTAEMQPPLSDVLTLDLTFGADEEKLPAEYLLIKPDSRIAINYNGDIIVGDEQRLKIYDQEGNPKKILGRRGQGPGDYTHAKPLIINDDYITGMDAPGQLNLRYHLYTSDHEFIDTKDPAWSKHNNKMLQEHEDWRYLVYNYIYHYDTDERLIFTGIGVKKGVIYRYYAVIYQNKNSSYVLVQEEDLSGNPLGQIDELGRILFQPLSDRRFVYTNAGKHKKSLNGKLYYSLFIYDIKTGEQSEIEKEYMPAVLPDSIIYRKKDYSDIEKLISEGAIISPTIEQMKDREKQRSEFLKEIGVYAPLQQLAADGDIIYAYTNKFEPGKGYLVDVFDSRSCTFFSSAFFPFVTTTIKNGYAYVIGKNNEGFAVIEKYKIDPAVYGK